MYQHICRILSLSSCALLAFLFLQISLITCATNPGRKINCYPTKLKYQKFPVDFYFSSRKKQNQLYNVHAAFGPEGIDFDPRRRTAVLVHGFMGSGLSSVMQSLSKSLIKWKDSNVIIVEWKKGCSDVWEYPQAVVNTEYAAIKIERLFSTFAKIWNGTVKSVEHWGPIHLIGHSLGAHVSGQAARLLKNKGTVIVHRVTGLDPAGPCFENANLPLRLDNSSARFVDVIHTDVSTAVQQGFGLRDPIGNVDFYINGGSKQPGCEIERRKRDVRVVALAVHALDNGACHHNRALTLFTETVKQAAMNGCQFWARPWNLNGKPSETRRILREECHFCVEVGINADKNYYMNSTYYLPTTGSRPFCTKSEFVQYEMMN